MTNEQLQSYYQNLMRRHFPRSPFKVQAQFYRNRTLRSEVRLQGRVISFRIAESLKQVPLRIHFLLGLILLSKLFRYRLHPEIRKSYNQYLRTSLSRAAKPRHRDPAKSYSPAGSVYDLREIFHRVNRRFFESRLPEPILGWSKYKAYARLGFYDRERNLLVISRIFDSKKTPQEVVEFLMYHEMLHIYLPAQKGRGSRRRVHTAEFNRLERSFPGYENIKRWIERKRKRL